MFTNYMHTYLLIILIFMTFGHSKLVRQQNVIICWVYCSPPTAHSCFITPLEFLTAPKGVVPHTLGTTALDFEHVLQ